MKKFFALTLISTTLLSMAQNNGTADKTIYQYKTQTIDGDIFDFSSLKGKKIMIVNTASKCGLTPQYTQLQELFAQYGGADFVIIGFPANNFLSQEPGTSEEIAIFCEKNYGVTFPIMARISVKGKEMHPIYQFLTQANKNGKYDSKVTWNFQKYLIDKNGVLSKVISPRTSPKDPEVIAWIEN